MADRTCSLPGCDRPHDARGLCALHYTRAKKAGTLPPLAPNPPLFLIDPDTGCWNWNRAISDTGYGTVGVAGRTYIAHRWVWQTLGQVEIPAGLHLDHLCRNRRCVNPAHLEPVTPRVNIVERGMSGMSAVHYRQTHCVNGHPFDEANTYRPPSRPHTRQCRACMKERDKRRVRDRRRAA